MFGPLWPNSPKDWLVCTQTICLELYINWLSAVFEAGEDCISGHVRQLIYHDVKINGQKKYLLPVCGGLTSCFYWCTHLKAIQSLPLSCIVNFNSQITVLSAFDLHHVTCGLCWNVTTTAAVSVLLQLGHLQNSFKMLTNQHRNEA